jgi:quercetin dioxygenase-like cupin family protein
MAARWLPDQVDPVSASMEKGDAMKVVKLSQVESQPAISTLFTGNPVSRQQPFDPDDSQNFSFGVVSFSAGSRNKFHKHSVDQLLIVTEGTGVVATDAEERVVTAGDVVLIPAGENHWHGAPGATPMAHITVVAKGGVTTQTEA